MSRRRRILAALTAVVLGSLSGAAASPAAAMPEGRMARDNYAPPARLSSTTTVAATGRASARRISARGLALIKEFEGFPNGGRPYNDPAPGRHCTVGYGHLIHYGPCTSADYAGRWLAGQKVAGRLSRAEADTLLRRRLDAHYEPHVRALPVRLNQNQHDSLTSFVFNVGPGGIASSTTVGRELRAKRWRKAADALLAWNKAGGVVLPGLVRRREAERRLFLTPVPRPAVSPPLTRVETRINRGIIRPKGTGHSRRYWCARNAAQRRKLRRLAARRGWRAQRGGARHLRLARRYAASCPAPRVRASTR